MKRIAFTAYEKAELIETEDPAGELGLDEVWGRSLVTLVSPGTELNFGYFGSKFPNHPGYASVFQVERLGAEVRDFALGDIVFCSEKHTEFQRVRAQSLLLLPAGLAPEKAVFARLAGVSMSSLNVTVVRPPSRVLVTGLGPVGILAAQIFQIAGYEVDASDPLEARRECAVAAGVRSVHARVDTEAWENRFHLQLECSGHEQAVLEGCRCLCKGGEIFLVGVPWKRRTEITSFELLREIFHRYVSVRSGWEWQVPRLPQDFTPNSIKGNLASAIEWIADGRLRVAGLGALYRPEQAQEVYAGLAAQTLPTSTAIFDWREGNAN